MEPSEREKLERAVRDALRERNRLRAQLEVARHQLREIEGSRIWRWTAPVRAAFDALRGGAHTGPQRTIALLVPVTSRGRAPRTIDDADLLRHFLPAFLASASWQGDIRYRLLVGIDDSDLFYADPERHAALQAALDAALRGRPARASLHVLSGAEHAPCRAWNALFRIAWDEGADYFFQLGDDVALLTPGWARRLPSALDANPVHPGLGVAGPVEAVTTRILTQAFVSRVHGEIFGTLFPEAFRNWYSDDWITEIYAPAHVFMCPEHVTVNEGGDERYEIDRAAEAKLADEVAAGRRRIAEWLAARGARS